MTRGAMLGLAVLALALDVPAFADDLDDQLDAARVQAKAGRIDRALAIVTSLAAVHRDDPRVHHFRYLYLKELGRPSEAAEALERAVTTMESFKKRGDKNPSITEMEPSIVREGNEFLANRRIVQKTLQAYREKALEIIKSLKEVEEPFVLYILEEIYRVAPSEPEELLAVWGRTSVDHRKAYEEREAKLRKEEKLTSPNPKLFKENLAQAEESLKGGNHREARISALAALEVAPRDAQALAVLSEVLWNLDRSEESVRAALEAVDAPKERDLELAKSVYDRAFRQIHKLSPKALEPFVRLRAETAKELLSVRDRASLAKESHNVDWIERMAARLAPGDPVVFGSIEKSRLSEEASRRLPLLGRLRPTLGFVDLLSAGETWHWRNQTEGSKLEEGVLRFTMHERKLMVEAFPKDFWLKPTFSLRFKFKYEIEAAQEPWLYLLLTAGPDSGFAGNAVIFFPEGDHSMAFASRRTNQAWTLRRRKPLPKQKAIAGEWTQVDLVWSDATKKVKVTVDEETVLDSKLQPEDTLHGIWSFGFAGAAKEFLIKEVLIKNED